MEFLRLLVVFFAAINPAGVLMAMRDDWQRQRRAQVVGIGAVFATVLLLLAVLLGDRLLDGLELDAESFRIAAAMILAACGVYTLWTGVPGSRAPGEPRLAHGWFPLGVPLLSGPASLAAAVSHGVDDGRWVTFGSAVVWVVVTSGLLLVWRGRWPVVADGFSRVTGALLVVVAAGLAISGIKAV
jgi:small neutral amino acid transporter SnatA (MarC family)